MRKTLLATILFACSLPEVLMSQKADIPYLMKQSVELYIKHRDSIENDMPYCQNMLPQKDENARLVYVVPELIGADRMEFVQSPACDDIALVWVKSRHDVKKLLRKRRSSKFRFYYRCALNIENGEVVIYVMTGFQRKIGETLRGRFSYGRNGNGFCLHTIEYQYVGTDTMVSCSDVKPVVSRQSYERMFAIFEGENVFGDTIDVVQNACVWKQPVFPKNENKYYRYHLMPPGKALFESTRPFLSVDYTINQSSDILVHFRTIYFSKQRGRYKKMQQHCSSDRIFTLSQDADGVYQITSEAL